MVEFIVYGFLFSKTLMWIFDVLGMQINPFEVRRQEEYLNPNLTSFQIMTCAPIWSAKGKLEMKTWIFWNFIIGRCHGTSNVTFYKTTFIKFSISISYGLSNLLVILQNPNKKILNLIKNPYLIL